MSAGPIRRLVGLLRRVEVLPGPAAVAATAPAGGSQGGERRPELTTHSNLRDVTAAIPGLREELIDRARSAGLLMGWLAAVLVSAWAVVDRVESPGRAGMFLAVRLLGEIPMLLALWALWRAPLGRRRPEALTFVVLAVVQVEIAWMIPLAEDATYYLLGLTLAVYGSGCVVVARPRWTAGLVGVSWVALGLSMLIHPGGLSAGDLLAVTLYPGTASVIAILAHLRRYALSNRELLTRVRLEREQQRTGVLLAQLERLSHEDPLTGLANRRRWDAELVSVCALARQRGSEWGSCSSTSTTSSRSTTGTVIPGATRRCARSPVSWPTASARRTSWPGSAATSSPSCCPTPTSTVRSSWPSGCGPRRRAWSRRDSPRRDQPVAGGLGRRRRRCLPARADVPRRRAAVPGHDHPERGGRPAPRAEFLRVARLTPPGGPRRTRLPHGSSPAEHMT